MSPWRNAPPRLQNSQCRNTADGSSPEEPTSSPPTSSADAAKRQPFHTVAICVLPNHLHCIWTLPEDDSDFSGRWRRIKSGFTRRLPRAADLAPGRRPGERGVWQRRFWEHVITDADDLAEHIAYVHGNPVKHRLVAEIDDWPFSSWHRWNKENGPGATG